MDIEVTRAVLDAMQTAAREAHPHEACGILLGERTRITELAHARNVHENPQERFEIDPQALIDAHRAARAGGPQVLGYFHSHPTGIARPSATDEKLAASDGAIWAIAAGKDVGFFRSGKVGFEALGTTIIQS